MGSTIGGSNYLSPLISLMTDDEHIDDILDDKDNDDVQSYSTCKDTNDGGGGNDDGDSDDDDGDASDGGGGNDEEDASDDDDSDEDDVDTSDGGVGGSNYLLPSLPCHSPLPLWEHVRQTLS